jgi:hypothetical protein
MTKITLDTTTCGRLAKMSGSAEICDPDGHTVGYFLPGQENPGRLPPGSEIPLSIEETELRRKTRIGRTLDEILQSEVAAY